MLTPGDVDFGARNFVGAIRLRLGLGAHRGQIAAGLWLGQVHGAAPFATDQLFQINGVELVAACGQQCLNGTVSEQGAQGKTQVGAVDHLTHHRANGLGQALTTKIHRVLQTLPTGLGKLLECFLEARGGCHHAVFPGGWVLVAFPVERSQHALSKLGGFFQHGLRGFQTGVFHAGQLRNLVNLGQMRNVEQHVFDGGFVTHLDSP